LVFFISAYDRKIQKCLAQNDLSQNDNPLKMMSVDLVTISEYLSSFGDYLQHLEVFSKGLDP
jgi:hypothetical protein